jgi:hypothetical protein
MGTAVLHTDPGDPKVQRFLGKGEEEFFWPEFPKGFIMIEVQPSWVEFISPTLSGHPEHWTPHAVLLDK